MAVYTLTLNPAFDLHAEAEGFVPHSENFVRMSSRDAGGKGINLSRALQALGVPSRALMLLGEENAGDFLALTEPSLNAELIRVPGRIRENLTIHEADGRETRISFPGFSVDGSALSQLEGRLKEVRGRDVVTVTGSLPEGLDRRKLIGLLAALRDRGALLVIDSRSFSETDLLKLRPWLIKPNEEELRHYMKDSSLCAGDLKAWAEGMNAAGIAQVLVTLGGKGAWLFSEGTRFFAAAPEIEAVSTIGAGDSAIAGFLAAFTAGKTLPERLRCAVAAGSAACLTAGTAAPKAADYKRLLAEISVTVNEEPN